MVLGGGPNRIGQGIEFDYCCVHAAFALRDEGLESIMVNCNPETVSTDYDTADKLYFEPLTVEDILAIYDKEQPEGVIVQFGGQTPLNLAPNWRRPACRSWALRRIRSILAEDRDRFRQMMRKLGIPEPESGMASTLEEALAWPPDRLSADCPAVFVLGGRAMEIVYDQQMLERYVDRRRGCDAGPPHSYR
jgi:carbamoyl-phosphate synthase large subunit